MEWWDILVIYRWTTESGRGVERRVEGQLIQFIALKDPGNAASIRN
jgi:hypothetical protein